ncbi:MAG: tRNA (adenosine(37)-N6)-threonylcarbamoyltransferase complex dimerization subunit type 1 TsaB, partial [Planctomycetes bacterium]|nr:tRNA (adenosine(37)-N6)-threonylcarbamoyltransferase complex dimerization subunit type 1 TsaB [Planctomycetota bacterium]
MTERPTVSVAIEASCRRGAVALGVGDELRDARELGSTRKHAAMLLPALEALLGEASLAPVDVDELYVSVGPGSFTGLRVGLTAARTWGQMQPDLRIAAVPTPLAIAVNVDADWQHVGVLLAAKRAGDA